MRPAPLRQSCTRTASTMFEPTRVWVRDWVREMQHGNEKISYVQCCNKEVLNEYQNTAHNTGNNTTRWFSNGAALNYVSMYLNAFKHTFCCKRKMHNLVQVC